MTFFSEERVQGEKLKESLVVHWVLRPSDGALALATLLFWAVFGKTAFPRHRRQRTPRIHFFSSVGQPFDLSAAKVHRHRAVVHQSATVGGALLAVTSCDPSSAMS